ncbi:Putative transmembrane protein (fragment) [Paraburkholderia piptadeniae]|uniref:Transmembrane protein n=1 Tax=Paraburkholderia piptadeniae TaxID=1701573 RepID=A0A1N7SX78_9BURK
MMYKAAWAAAKLARLATSEASKGVSVPVFAYPDKVQWDILSRRVISELREYPATVHDAREYVESFREFGDLTDICEQVEYECAKAATSALALARTTRRREGAAAWKPGAKDSAMERELSDFIAKVEAKRKASFEWLAQSIPDGSINMQTFK